MMVRLMNRCKIVLVHSWQCAGRRIGRIPEIKTLFLINIIGSTKETCHPRLIYCTIHSDPVNFPIVRLIKECPFLFYFILLSYINRLLRINVRAAF